jgi:phosphoserine aminotransferase
MKNLYLAPGPTKVHPELMTWLADADADGVFSKSHRSTWFEAIVASVQSNLRTLLDIPEDYAIAFTTSATEVWERAIESCVEKESFHLVGGEFSTRWYQFAERLGRTPSRADYGVDFTGRFDEFEIPDSAEMICLTQSETSIGSWIPDDQIARLARANPEKLMAVDVVSAVPTSILPWKHIDITFFSIQKGLCLPAGLGIVILSPRAVARSKEMKAKLPTVGAYHWLENLAIHAQKNLTVETPNVLAIYLVKRALEKYVAIGTSQLRLETYARATGLMAAIEAETPFRALTKMPQYRAPTVLAITTDKPVEEFRKNLIKEHNVYLAACYSEHKANGLRIANFPIHTNEDHARALELLKTF